MSSETVPARRREASLVGAGVACATVAAAVEVGTASASAVAGSELTGMLLGYGADAWQSTGAETSPSTFSHKTGTGAAQGQAECHS